ncbi:MAG: IS1380 family transposase [Herbaspirillum sp.]|uniref:IS1380 family transposase n=1 Tax=Herbaspirillum sp. TaxID=1890675 RepID=UPI002582EE4E|nr:IS1380 family transposase [Herbaspirillum sp.]MCP4557320.1 IS1380 family transposase [Herbaspirillum sp.]
MTQCSTDAIKFKTLAKRSVVADFSGGHITSDAGALLLDKVEQATGVLRRAAGCFTDHRNSDLIEHTVEDLIRQRVFALALGYEDLNDHDELSRDPLLAAVVGKTEPTGQGRRCGRDRDRPLAGKSTLNRLELTAPDADAASRYKKTVLDFEAMESLFVEVFLDAYAQRPEQIIVDLDATDDPLHGRQEGRFFHGYYKHYCYLPLYAFCGEHLLAATLRPADIDASAGTVELLEALVGQIRRRWPDTQIIVRADSGFAREAIMAWCEANAGVDYVLGLARNSRLVAEIADELAEARSEWEQTGQAARRFKDFTYRTLDSWSRTRRVVGKAEHLDKGANPRFVVTSLGPVDSAAWAPRALYEQTYCARGEMENRIKEQQLCLFADRTSTHWMRSNQIRLWLSSLAYVLVSGLRRLGLSGTSMARSRCDTIRLRLLKIGAAVRVSVRRVWVSLASGYPLQALFGYVCRRLEAVIRRQAFRPLRC